MCDTAQGAVEEDAIVFEDFMVACRRVVPELRRRGAEAVIAMTHMRMPNDVLLAREMGTHAAGDAGVDLILGGHDHDYLLQDVNGVLVVKSGTEFRYLTEVNLDFSKPTVADPATNKRGLPFTATYVTHEVTKGTGCGATGRTTFMCMCV